MLKDFTLSSEIAALNNLNMVNISIAIKKCDLVEGLDYLKFGGITLLSHKTDKLPKYIHNLLFSNEYTNMSKYIPYIYFKEICEGKISGISDKFKNVVISGKQFVEITDKELRNVISDTSLVKAVVPKEEVDELLKNGYIQGFIDLKKSHSLVWY